MSKAIGSQYVTTGDPATNVWSYAVDSLGHGGMNKTSKFFSKGSIISGTRTSLKLWSESRKNTIDAPFIQIGVNEYVRPVDVIISKSYSKADGDATTANGTPAIVKALPTILSSVGFIWGLGYSFKNKKGFWAYVGYSFLGSIAGATAGGIVYVIANPASVTKAPFSGADGKSGATNPSTHKQKWGCGERDGVECCRPRRWKFNGNTNQYVCV